METVSASVIERKFVNRGFLIGPFCPIYGFGAVLVIQSSKWVNSVTENYFMSLIISILFAIILVTVLEYITGFALEKVFNCKWWDYSNKAANLQGYICLRYSILWGLLAFLLIQVVHPLMSEVVFQVSDPVKSFIAMLIILYLFTDTIKSVFEILDLRKVIHDYLSLPANKYYEKIIRYKRIFLAFPRLLILNAGIVNRDIRSVLNDGIDKIKYEIKSRFQ